MFILFRIIGLKSSINIQLVKLQQPEYIRNDVLQHSMVTIIVKCGDIPCVTLIKLIHILFIFRIDLKIAFINLTCYC